jgi:hypothetical protein
VHGRKELLRKPRKQEKEKNLEDIQFAVVRSQLRVVDRQYGMLVNVAETTLERTRAIAA